MSLRRKKATTMPSVIGKLKEVHRRFERRYGDTRRSRWDARCLDCRWKTGFVGSRMAQTKAHAHRAARAHDVELYVEAHVETLVADRERDKA